MMQKNSYPRWVRNVALFLVGVCLQALLHTVVLRSSIAQPAPAKGGACAVIRSPLTAAEQEYARTAWQYFVKNYQPATGFVNSVANYPSGSLWDMGNYLTALNSARWLNLIDQKEFDSRLNKFLTSLNSLTLFENALPNKVYNAATGQMTDYNNQPVDRGLGWSALDIGRLLAAFDVVRTCHPQYGDWMKGIVSKWQIGRSLKDGQLFGATVLPDGKTLLVQEGRLGYEEYAARGYELWGFKAPKALALEPFKLVDINSFKVPADTRDYKSSGANNYVVSESYILDGIEFGFKGVLAEYAAQVLKAQKRRYEITKQLTAVSEDNIDQAPYFIYNTVYANGNVWAAITEKNEPYPQFRSISTKAAFGWHYLYPKDPYTQKLFDAVKDLRSPDGGGFYAGLYEESKQPVKALTGNTNGLILEILYYKARGNRPLIGADRVTFANPRGPVAVEKTAPAKPTPKKLAPTITTAPSTKPEATKPQPSETNPPLAPPAPSRASVKSCTSITAPLTPDEQKYARIAWQYFVKNYQPATGFVSSVADYPSGSLWDMGNYLTALHAARSLNLVDQAEFDRRTTKFLDSFNKLKLFDGALPNKVYNAATGQLTDYANKPVERGIGWSALDIGRFLAAMHIIRTCHPQYYDTIKTILSQWKIRRSLKDGQLYGAYVPPDGKMLPVQEGRFGYEEYAARGYELWGLKPEKALELEPFKFVEVNGVQIPVDSRDYQSSGANNYVVSESYILDGIEFGLEGVLAEYAVRVLDAQKRRYDATGQLTAVSEDNIDQAPYFIYNTVYANGNAWAAINEKNEPFPQFRSISTKAAFGWRYLYPDNAYAKKVFDAVKDLSTPDGGFYAGLYEESKQPNKILTGNTNGLILEVLHYKARGNRPLIGPELVTFAAPKGSSTASKPMPAPSSSAAPATSQPNGAPTVTTPTTAPAPAPPPVKVAAIARVGEPKSSSCPLPAKALTFAERRHAQAAWAYFQTNYNPNTGLVSDRSNLKGATLWGLGNYVSALHVARSLDLISVEEFDNRVRLLLGAFKQLPLFTGELPYRGYDTRTLQAIDYGSNSVDEGNGWSGMDVGRWLTALHNLKTCHPEYTDAVDRTILDWSFLRVVRNGQVYSAITTRDDKAPTGDRWFTRANPINYLGYEEYAARGFQLWGFDAARSAVGGQYETMSVEGVPVPTRRLKPNSKSTSNSHTVSDPFLLYGLEFGLDPQMKTLIEPILQAQAERYRRTGIFTAAGTTLVDKKPFVVHSTIVGNRKPWATLGDDESSVPELRLVSSAIAFAFRALLPDNDYARQLEAQATDLYSSSLGYYEGFYERTGKPTMAAFSGGTNSLILQAILYQTTNQQPLIRPTASNNSPWWQTIAKGDSGRGLPEAPSQSIRLVNDATGTYWTATERIPVTLRSSQSASEQYSS